MDKHELENLKEDYKESHPTEDYDLDDSDDQTLDYDEEQEEWKSN